MRLIDADALIERIKDRYCTECDNYYGVRCRACSADDAISMADESQTVEAIPVKWLLDRLDEILTSGVLSGKPDDNLNIRSIIQVLRLWGIKMEVKA